jgi:hypothetical protein
MIEVINRYRKKLTTLKWEYKETVKDKDAASYADTIGSLPYVVINGVTIESKDIHYFKLHNDRFFPELEMTFEDPTNKIWDSSFPLDQQIVSILIKSNSDLLMPIRMDFWIYEFNSVKNKSGEVENKRYNLYAKLNVSYIIKNASFKGTSYDVLKKLAEEAELGFASNIDSTNDDMTWINCGIDYIREQVPEIVKRSYINDNTFTWAYVDFWYNLNYIDIEKQLKEDTKNARVVNPNASLTGNDDTIPLILSNHPNYRPTNLYIEKFNLLNSSTEVNQNLGYKPHIYYYATKERNVTNVLLDTLSDKGDNSDKIVLKGQPSDNNFALDQQKNYFLGKIDTDNTHDNYLYAEQLNLHNIEFLQNVSMTIVLRNINFQLYRFQLVKIDLYKLRELDSNPNVVTQDDIVSGKDIDKYKLNERLSGDWLIIGINYTYVKSGLSAARLTQEITLVRKDLSAAKIAKNDNIVNG